MKAFNHALVVHILIPNDDDKRLRNTEILFVNDLQQVFPQYFFTMADSAVTKGSQYFVTKTASCYYSGVETQFSYSAVLKRYTFCLL